MKSIIESLGMFVPPHTLPAREVLAGCHNQILYPLERFTGIRSVRRVGKGESFSHLAKKAVEQCFSTSKYTPQDIDLLISCGISKNESNIKIAIEPSISIKLKKHFGFEKALAFDVLNSCAGMFTAILIVDAFIKAGCIRCGMVVSGEYTTHLIETAQKEIAGLMDPRMACLTVGDAGVALTLERSPSENVGFHDIELYTLGYNHPLCIAKATDQAHGGAIMFSEPTKLMKAVLENAGQSWSVVKRSGIPPASFNHLILHQTSSQMIQSIQAEMNRFFGDDFFHAGNTIDNLAERGNTGSNTHFVAVADKILENSIHSGDSIIFGISGAGQTLGTALYTFDDLPDRLRNKTENKRMALNRSGASNALTIIPPPYNIRVRIESIGTIPKNGVVPTDAIAFAKAGAEECLKQSSLSRSQIDLLIYTGIYRHDVILEPAIAAILAGELDINAKTLTQTPTFTFDIHNGAMGFLNACSVAVQMIGAEAARHVMVAASEIEYNRQSYPENLMGLQETGSAVILTESENNKTGFGHFVFRYLTDHQALYTANGVWKNERGFLDVHKHPDLELYLVDTIPSVVEELLTLERLDQTAIQYILPPQISPSFIAALSNHLQIPNATIIDATRGSNDLFTSSIPYAFRTALDRYGVRVGEVGLIISVGAGLQVGCAVYYF